MNFVDLIDAGDPVETAKAYDKIGADEIVFLDITKERYIKFIINNDKLNFRYKRH